MPTVGVIVGRFQTDEIHDGHRELIASVRERHAKVLILIGCTQVKMSPEDPLDYQTRERMLREEFPDVVTAAIEDCSTDEAWSRQLDRRIHEMFPLDVATLYGSRDSFVPHYLGKYKVQEIPEVSAPSATTIRQRISDRPLHSRDFRAGVIYACGNRYPVSYPTVDIAVIDASGVNVLLGRKKSEPGWRFIGGFVDRSDASLEAAARRELREEAGDIEVSDPHYIGSYPITDWRYDGRKKDGIITTFFVANYIFGRSKAGDDIDEVQWIPCSQLPDVLVPEHQPLRIGLITFLEQEQTKKG